MDEARKSAPMTPIERAREAAFATARRHAKMDGGSDDKANEVVGITYFAIDAYETALKEMGERDGASLLREANRLRQVVEHLHALVHSRLGAAETVRKAQMVLSKSMAEAVDFPPAMIAAASQGEGG